MPHSPLLGPETSEHIPTTTQCFHQSNLSLKSARFVKGSPWEYEKGPWKAWTTEKVVVAITNLYVMNKNRAKNYAVD